MLLNALLQHEVDRQLNKMVEKGSQGSSRGNEVNRGGGGVLDFATLIAQQLQNQLAIIVAQVGNHVNNQGNNRNQDDNVINDNNPGNARTMNNGRGQRKTRKGQNRNKTRPNQDQTGSVEKPGNAEVQSQSRKQKKRKKYRLKGPKIENPKRCICKFLYVPDLNVISVSN
nr:hypothetical protein [Tanacetum cinerariifolium]